MMRLLVAVLLLMPTLALSAEPVVITGRATAINGNLIEIKGTRIRLWGVDAPDVGTEAGRLSKAFLDGFLFGRDVTCVWVKSHGPTAAKCLIDGTVAGVDMIDITETLKSPGPAGD